MTLRITQHGMNMFLGAYLPAYIQARESSIDIKTVDHIFASVNEVSWDDPMLRGHLDILLAYEIITPAKYAETLTPAYVEEWLRSHGFVRSIIESDGEGMITDEGRICYRVLIPAGVTNPLAWISNFATSSINAMVSGGHVIVEAFPGTFNHPDMEAI
jgi:hypothetical protein